MTSARPDADGCERGLLTDRPLTDLARESPIVLDSWHLYDGRAVAVARHCARFTASVSDVFGAPADEVGAAYDHVLGHLPTRGSWFPAFAWTVGGLRAAIRPFPVEHLRATVTLDDSPLLDARKRPDVKGVDYLWQLRARAAAVDAGYDDRLLVTSTGLVSETVFGTLAVIRPGELVVPDAPRLPGVTLSVARDLAGDRDLRVVERAVPEDEVRGADGLLVLSALHGVRVVERLGDRVLPTGRTLRDLLQADLDAARAPVSGGCDACASC